MKSFHSRAHRPAPERETLARTPTAKPAGVVRADLLVVEHGLAPSRALARRVIEQGLICTTLGVVHKASQLLPVNTQLALCEAPPSPDVSQDRDPT